MANLELLRETRVRADRQDGNSNQASISLSTKDCMSRHRNSKLSFSHLASPHFFVSGARRRWWERKGEGDKTKTENGRKNGDKKKQMFGRSFLLLSLSTIPIPFFIIILLKAPKAQQEEEAAAQRSLVVIYLPVQQPSA